MDWESTWDWWLVYGFQGIAGGVIGGLVTGAAVWLTLRHERALRRDELDREDLLEQKRVVSRILEKAIDLDAAIASGGATDSDIRLGMQQLDREIRLSLPTLAPLGGLGRTLQKAVGVIHIITGRPKLSIEQTGEVAHAVVMRCGSWLKAPDQYDDGWHDAVEKRVSGSTTMDDVMFTPYDEVLSRALDPDEPVET